ncbi:hypothetical protein KCV87_33100 [Actinosynnema pretiosum subsp. pretiosum]|uniref:Uncharacterized protein n=2 Tax=Actinosynnema TaxID=40566 RepID=C6WLH5_ACTMD|nr:hypothetical protein [Actinosynnema mirum]ACU38368.1 hypothetical protein Amir_4524 [Actinosynnema mirum DSM 43827]AXX31891.1 hypothetical protein APASM_4526 [Actinosynnema pretiosum subsp. pretiosum]QUF04122.1 hypothetical protein KCV87_33100 [Actinosynnema pretiosum subsp. pretiosum]
MSGERVGEYRLKRQRAGVGYFGQVRVRVVDGAPEGAVVWAVDPGDRSSLQPGLDQEFVDAAVAGAWDGLGVVGRSGGVVEVLHVQVDLTDIEVSAVRAAAAMAVVEAFGVGDRVELVFDGGWGVVPVA